MSRLSSVSLGVVLGLVLGLQLGNTKYHKLLTGVHASVQEAIATRDKINKELEKLADDRYQAYLDITNRPPTVITDRVYVKASCSSDVPGNKDTAVDDGDSYSYAELHPTTVRNLARVTDSAEQDMLRCQEIVSTLTEQIRRVNE